jgi:hypothetical protein
MILLILLLHPNYPNSNRSVFDAARSVFDAARSVFDAARSVFDAARSVFDAARSVKHAEDHLSAPNFTNFHEGWNRIFVKICHIMFVCRDAIHRVFSKGKRIPFPEARRDKSRLYNPQWQQ